ncbi:MAG: hypothetical protein LBG28_01390 [Tannerella sp.]|jgi:hypothetical protein|nr:hypothetical protein [Tannerella sp.]
MSLKNNRVLYHNTKESKKVLVSAKAVNPQSRKPYGTEERRKKIVFNVRPGRMLFISCLLFFALTGVTNVEAQSVSNSATAGREFYVSFLYCNYNPPTLLELKVVVKKSCYITAKYNNVSNTYWNNWNNTLVTPGIYTSSVLYNNMMNTSTGTSSKTMTIVSTEDVNVYAINYILGSTDATTILPVSTWGTEYHLATGMPLRDPSAQNQGNATYSVTAKEDDTKVTLHNNTTVTLKRNEVYHCLVSSDLTGKKITATKPVAVFSGNTIAWGPGHPNIYCTDSRGGSAEHCYEQLWSVDKWGSDFFIWPVKVDIGFGDWGGMIAIVAHENATHVTVSGDINGGTPLNYTLNATEKQYVCPFIMGLTRITSDNPIMVFTILPNAAITYIPPTNQRITHAVLSPFVIAGTTNIEAHMVELLIPGAYWDRTEIKENGATIDPDTAYTVTTSADFPDWYTVRRRLTNTDITIDISCPGGMLAYMYGYGWAETYGYLAGSGAYDLQCYFTVKEKATNHDTYYENTSEFTHTFLSTDNIPVKRTIEKNFTSVSWLINNVRYTITENPGLMINTLNFPAAAFRDGENTLTMSVRFQGATIDSLYTGKIWIEALRAVNDTLTSWSGVPAMVDVLDNDRLLSVCTPVMSIVAPPKHGTASMQGATIVYMADFPWAGKDSLEYKIDCGTEKDSAWVYVNVEPLPGNVIETECYINPPATTVWGIRELSPENVAGRVHNLGPLTVGNLDGNDTTLIIGFLNNHGTDMNNSTLGYPSHGLRIFYFDKTEKKVKLKKEFSFPAASATPSGSPVSTFSSTAIARYNKTGYIVVAGSDRYLYAYRADGTQLWKSNAPYSDNTDYLATIVNIADFNCDGIPEVYTGNKIFSLATGHLLCSGSGNTGILYRRGGDASIAADVVPSDRNRLELCAGTQIYRVTIPQGATTTSPECSMSVIADMELPAAAVPSNASKDGATQVVDIDNDGTLEVVVVTRQSANTGHPVVTYVWKPLLNNASYLIGQHETPGNSDYYGIPAIGNIDGDEYPEIVYIGMSARMYALDYAPGNASGNRLVRKWEYAIDNGQASMGITLFDFNDDGIDEIIYRDENRLYIINGNATTPERKALFGNVHSFTLREYPVVADIDDDGQAEIIVSGGKDNTEDQRYNGYVRIFKSDGLPWAPARKVWNQYAYNAANVNEDVTIPKYQLYPATFFVGEDGFWETSDDVQPYNNFRRQQTILSHNGIPLWLAPNAVFDESHISTSNVGDSVSVSICIVNKGNAAIDPPVYATLYKDDVNPGNIIATNRIDGYIQPGDTACLTIGVSNVRSFLPFVQLVVRLNDNGATYPVQMECDCGDSVRMRPNPALHLMMTKNATLNGTPRNGAYHNPVSVLYNENIKYDITAVNANLRTGRIIITDTLPPYLNYAGNATGGALTGIISSTPPRSTIRWEIPNVASFDTVKVSFEATPESGASASQPLFINKAWVYVSDTLLVQTNNVYHQGAGVSVVTFSASVGGRLYNTEPQALDYKTSLRAGSVLVVPDEGYEFAGWSHDEYKSLRGETVKADSGIMNYEEIVIYGDVELRANFVSVVDKPDDKKVIEEEKDDNTDKVWSYDGDLYICTKKGATIRIYSPDGILQRQFTVAVDGTTTVRLGHGVYIVTLNGGIGYKMIF